MTAGRLIVVAVAATASPIALAAGGVDGEVTRQPLNVTAIALFLTFVLGTLGISYWASKRTRDSGTFYNAGGQITPLQNGVAIAGDFMSAASFLGVTGLIFMLGVDGLILVLAPLSGWPLMLILMSERVRNLGKYTLIDVISNRLDPRNSRMVAIIGAVSIVIFYLIAQMVAAGKLIELLFGLDYLYAVVIVNVLVIVYVAFGGMLATTWVQIIKASLLLLGGLVISLLVMAKVGFSFGTLLEQAVDAFPRRMDALRAASSGLNSSPLQVATIAFTMMLGPLGLPHVLMRLFTVRDMTDAKKSIFYASGCMGLFYIMVLIIGFATIAYITGNPDYLGADGKLAGGNNMVSIHLAHYTGGNLLMGFMSAVAFATILAVVAGLVVAGSASVSHDLYAELICKGKPDPKKELLITRCTALTIGVIGIVLGVIFEKQNVAFLATMAMVVSASVTFPILAAVIFWRGTTTRGVVAGVLTGFISSITLIVLGPRVWVEVLGYDAPLFPYDFPGLFCVPLAFLAIWLFSVTDRSARADRERASYDEQLLQSELALKELEVSAH